MRVKEQGYIQKIMNNNEKIDPRFNETTSKREMFAAMMMAALVSSNNRINSLAAAAWAVGYADDLIAELKKSASILPKELIESLPQRS